MNIHVLINPVDPLFYQPFLPASIQVTPNKNIISRSGYLVEIEVKPIFKILDVLQIWSGQ